MSVYLAKQTEFQLQFGPGNFPSAELFLDADFDRLNEAYRKEPKRKRRKLGRQANERSPIVICCLLNRPSSNLVMRAFGVDEMDAFVFKHRKFQLQMILKATFEDGFSIYCKMSMKSFADHQMNHFEGTVGIQPTQMFVADQIYKGRLTVEIVDSAAFGFVKDCTNNGLKQHRFLEDNRFCDFKIIADNGAAIHCHKLALAAGSPAFERMFGADDVETRGNQLRMDTSEAVVQAFLKHIYGLDLQDVFEAPDIAVELMELGHKYEIGTLEKAMKKLIKKRADEWLTIDSGLNLFLYSVNKEGEEYQELKEKGLRIVRVKRDELNESSVFQQLLGIEPATETVTNLVKLLLQP